MTVDKKALHYGPIGIPDDRFVRGGVPMTKAEVRALLMTKARLCPGARVLDVGAGSGSLTVEACLLCPGGEVVAVERDPEALPILRANLERFGLLDRSGLPGRSASAQVQVIAGEAPDALTGLGRFDRVLVGGSGGRLAEILAVLPSILLSGGRVVCPCVCVESLASAVACLRGEGWRGFDCIQASIARGVLAGRQLRFDALNPVWIVSAERAGSACETVAVDEVGPETGVKRRAAGEGGRE